MTLRFIGIEADVAGKKLERFGQAFELPDAEANSAMARNLPALPDLDFEACGFTSKELDRYAYAAARSECDPIFAEKWLKARIALHNIREGLRAGKVG